MTHWKRRICALFNPDCNEDSGQALLELALIVPMLAFLLIGAVELSRVAYAAIEVSNAAHAGAQYGAQSIFTSGDLTGITNAASNDAANITLSSTTSTASYSCSDGSTPTISGGDPVCTGTTANLEKTITVVTTAQYKPGFLLSMFGSTFTLTGQDVQKVLIQ